MKSGKQRRKELRTARDERRRKREVRDARDRARFFPVGHAPCNPLSLVPYNSYGAPAFVVRGFYEDLPFECVGCGVAEVWTATQQKRWYEVAKGNVETTAKRCRVCRRRERARKAEARRVMHEGLERKRWARGA